MASCMLSTSSVAHAGQLIKTPIQTHGVEGRYAAALYSAAHKQNKLEAVDKDLTASSRRVPSSSLQEVVDEAALLLKRQSAGRAAEQREGVLEDPRRDQVQRVLLKQHSECPVSGDHCRHGANPGCSPRRPPTSGVKLLMFEQLDSLCQGWTMNPLDASRTTGYSSGGEAAIFTVSGRDIRQADNGIQLHSPGHSELLKSSPLPTLFNYRPSLIVRVCQIYWLHVMVGQMQSRAIVECGSCLWKLMYPQIPTKNK